MFQTTTDNVDNITESHAGVWTCVITQEDFGFKWTTNWFYLEGKFLSKFLKTIPGYDFSIIVVVKPAPSFWSHLMEDTATAPLFGKLPNEKYVIAIFSVFVIIILGAAVTVTVLMVKWLK